MITETTQNNDTRPARGWVCYDADCPWCRRLARGFADGLTRRGFFLIPSGDAEPRSLEASRVLQRLGITPNTRLNEMKVLTADNRIFGGAAGVVELAKYYRWAAPFVALARAPWCLRILEFIYRFIADCRPCVNGACKMRRPASMSWLDCLPLLFLPALAAFLTWSKPAWVLMWSVSFALWSGLKWLTWRDAVRLGNPPSWLRTLGYFFAWPGTDARAFLDGQRKVTRPPRHEWFCALATTALGIAFVWGLVPQVVERAPLLGGWVGMVGLILALHFGAFHLLALAWQSAGVDAEPLMRNPLRATSLAEFWGRRWNLGFSVPARRFILQPLLLPLGRARAMLVVFLVSGLVHDLVLSLPARAGYGWPTAYFLMQGLAVGLERTRFAHRLGLGRGTLGWLFTLVCTAGPAYWLFHPTFVQHVILPFLGMIGAT